jgi:hypothetical protein
MLFFPSPFFLVLSFRFTRPRKEHQHIGNGHNVDVFKHIFS